MMLCSPLWKRDALYGSDNYFLGELSNVLVALS